MKIAVIKTGGKQYKVQEKQSLKIEKINTGAGGLVKFNTLMMADGADLALGKPWLGEKVEAKILEHGKGKKVRVVKYKNKTRYRRNIGHRQPFTKILVEKIG